MPPRLEYQRKTASASVHARVILLRLLPGLTPTQAHEAPLVLLAGFRPQRLLPRSSVCSAGADHTPPYHLLLDLSHQANAIALHPTILAWCSPVGLGCQPALPHSTIQVPRTRYHHWQGALMNQTYLNQEQVARAVGEVWIFGGRSGGDFETRSAKTKQRGPRREGILETSLGITYLDLFLAERDAIHNICPGHLVWLWVLLVFEFKNCVVLRAKKKKKKSKYSLLIGRVPIVNAGLFTSSGVVSGEQAICCRHEEEGFE